MSHLRAKCLELRAALSVAAMCALFFGLLISGAAQARQSVGSHLPCVVAHVDETQAQTAPAENDNHAPGADCPDCCLAAYPGAVVLPGRVAVAAQPVAIAGPALVYADLAAREPQSFLTRAVNGARAPPL